MRAFFECVGNGAASWRCWCSGSVHSRFSTESQNQQIFRRHASEQVRTHLRSWVGESRLAGEFVPHGSVRLGDWRRGSRVRSVTLEQATTLLLSYLPLTRPMKLLGMNCVSYCIGGKIMEPCGVEPVIHGTGHNIW